MKILHLTNWYPSKSEPFKALFVKEHFEAISKYANCFLIHAEVVFEKGKLLKIKKTQLSPNEVSYVIYTGIWKWLMVEWISSILTRYLLFKYKYKDYDIINVHTAYPLTTFLFKTVRKQKPVVLVEHWTAFHYNFNLPKTTNKLNRIKRIYQKNIPLFTVSKRLKNDIEEFVNRQQNGYILPNVVNKKVFYYDKNVQPDSCTFFMVNFWREIKSPFPVLHAFKEFVKTNPEAQLRIGGYGPLLRNISDFVSNNRLQYNIVLLGPLKKDVIATEMRNATAFLHNADYETFSVVCAEAICCGTPVIINFLEAVSEFINETNGILITEDTSWVQTLKTFDSSKYLRDKISQNAHDLFSKEIIGRKYFELNEGIYKSHDRNDLVPK